MSELTFVAAYGPAHEHQEEWLPAILEVRQAQAEAAAGRIAIPIPANADSLSRYQAALDNEWYKAMRAFREARNYRLNSITGEASPVVSED